jgi:hypothetical protein
MANAWNSANTPTQAEKDAATIAALRTELEALKSKPVCVTVPPIEWEEQYELNEEWGDRAGLWVESKGGKYSIHGVINIGGVLRWKAIALVSSHKDAGSVDYILTENASKEDAQNACQDFKQEKVNKKIAKLKDCNVIPFRDPQGLVDALGRISNMPIPWYKDGHPSEKEIAQSALKAWEDEK